MLAPGLLLLLPSCQWMPSLLVAGLGAAGLLLFGGVRSAAVVLATPGPPPLLLAPGSVCGSSRGPVYNCPLREASPLHRRHATAEGCFFSKKRKFSSGPPVGSASFRVLTGIIVFPGLISRRLSAVGLARYRVLGIIILVPWTVVTSHGYCSSEKKERTLW